MCPSLLIGNVQWIPFIQVTFAAGKTCILHRLNISSKQDIDRLVGFDISTLGSSFSIFILCSIAFLGVMVNLEMLKSEEAPSMGHVASTCGLIVIFILLKIYWNQTYSFLSEVFEKVEQCNPFFFNLMFY